MCSSHVFICLHQNFMFATDQYVNWRCQESNINLVKRITLKDKTTNTGTFILFLQNLTAKDNEKEMKNASKTNERERGKREERLMEYNARIESTCLYWTACCCCKTHQDKNKILYVFHVNCIEMIENGMRMYTSLTIPLKSLGMYTKCLLVVCPIRRKTTWK